MINILKPNYKWAKPLSNRSNTFMIVLHHAAMDGTPEEIHQLHINNGWAGIGYHFYIRKNGNIYEGRPINKVGAHCVEYNSNSIGICFEGNFEREKNMPELQLKAGKELINYIYTLYPNLYIYRHSDLYKTACPGKYFPVKEISQTYGAVTSINDILWELMDKGIITEAEKWNKKMAEDQDVYWICYKMANKLRGTL